MSLDHKKMCGISIPIQTKILSSLQIAYLLLYCRRKSSNGKIIYLEILVEMSVLRSQELKSVLLQILLY